MSPFLCSTFFSLGAGLASKECCRWDRDKKESREIFWNNNSRTKAEKQFRSRLSRRGWGNDGRAKDENELCSNSWVGPLCLSYCFADTTFLRLLTFGFLSLTRKWVKCRENALYWVALFRLLTSHDMTWEALRLLYVKLIWFNLPCRGDY